MGLCIVYLAVPKFYYGESMWQTMVRGFHFTPVVSATWPAEYPEWGGITIEKRSSNSVDVQLAGESYGVVHSRVDDALPGVHGKA